MALAFAAGLLGGGWAQAAPREDPDVAAARRHFGRAQTLYDADRYAEAAEEFEAARRVLSLPALDFNIARCEERLEHWGRAADAYERYLAGAPDAANATALRARVQVLRARVTSAPVPLAGATLNGATLTGATPPAVVPPATTVTDRARTLRGAAIGTGVLAVVLAAAGTGLYLSVYGDYQARRDRCLAVACAESDVADLRSRVQVAERGGAALWSLAGIAAAADAALWVLDARARRTAPRVWLSPGLGGAALVGTF